MINYIFKMKELIDVANVANAYNKVEKKENDIDENDEYKDLMDNIKNIPIIESNEIIVKDSKYYKAKFKNLLKKGPIFIAFLLAYLLYFFSLEGCYEGEGTCTLYIDWIYLKVSEEVISIIIMIIIIQLMIFKIISKIHLIHFIIIFIIFYKYSHGGLFEDHGYFNFFFYFIILGIITFILLPFDLMIYFFKGKKRLTSLIIYFSFFIILISILLFHSSKCSEWSKGLNDTYIDNDNEKYGCQIQIPSKCVYKIFGVIQDYTKLIGKNCTKLNNKKMKDIIFKRANSSYINNTSNHVGFPLTNKDPICFLDSNINYIYKYVFENLVDMENREILDKYFKEKVPEIYVDFNKEGKGKLIIDIKFNKTLSNERELLEKNSNPYSNNILILYIDSLSRANAIRQLKKTMKFFEKFMSYKGAFNEKYPSENFHSFQFFKYQSFYGYTSINYPFLFFGQKKENKNKILRTKYLKEKGYITSNTNDYCNIDSTRTYHNYSINEMYDHQFLICDPNNEHQNLNTIRCLYDKQNIEHLYDYTEQFWRKYSNNRKYSLIITNHGHEGTLSVIKYVDEIITNFLNRLFNDNLLKEKSIIFLSDHGVGMPSIYYLYDFYQTEIHLPAFFLIINDRKNISYEEQYKYINKNQQTFITAFDIYNTIENLIYGDEYTYIYNKTLEKDTSKSPLGISLFDKINQKDRYPSKYNDYSGLSLSVCK